MALPDGRIGLLDCGMVGRVDDRTRALMEDLVISLTSKDVEGIVDTLLELCAVPPNFERQAFEVEVNDFLGDYLDLPISQTSFSGMINTMLGAIYRFHIIPPANVIMLLKTISLLEGTGQLLDPDFNLQELMRPHITKIVARRYAPEVILRRLTRSLRSWERLILALPRDLNQTLDKIRQGQLEIKLDIVGLDRTANRLIYGVVVAALLVGSAIVLTAAVPPTFRDISVFGIVGFVIAFVLSIRLLRAIEKSGKL
ncbi:MAG: AarF/ABC1/UbiB kinase family protein [Anaerolineae bacterium]|nr:AarF/ABC1/UbiB kinase family protein [Anaerolineae bacterium]